MKRGTLWAWAFGITFAVASAIGRRRARRKLALPVQSTRVTVHGHYGAPRVGPPAHAHQGIDLIARPGSYVLAVGDGEIVPTLPGLGRVVRKLELDHAAPFTLGLMPVDTVVYADLGTPLVHPGDRVKRGDAIAFVGNEGFVHFAVKRGDRFMDPRLAGFAYRVIDRGVA